MQYNGARIVTFSASDKVRNFTLSQRSRNLLFRLHTSEFDEEFVLSKMNGTAPQHLIVSFGRGHLVAYLNGKPSETEVPGDLSAWSGDERLLLGNEADGRHAWKGHIDRLAFFSRFIDAPEAARRYAANAK